MKAKLLIPLIALLAGCNAANKPLTEAQKQAVLKEAAPVVKSMFDALAVNDTVKVISLCDNNPQTDIILPVGIFNYKEMRKFVSQSFAMVEKQSFETKTESYLVIDKTCFIYTWYGRNLVYIKGAGPIAYDDLFDSFTFKKTGDGWKLVHLHESSKEPDISDPVKFFTKVEDEWGDAIYRKDAKALDLIFADEFIHIRSKGNISYKQEDINELTGPSFKLLAPIKLSDINVRMYGTVAVIIGTSTSESVFNGQKISSSFSFMDIMTYRDGRWQCIITQYIQKPHN